MAIELLQLQDRHAREHAAAEKHEARMEPIPPRAGSAMQLRAAPIYVCLLCFVGNVKESEPFVAEGKSCKVRKCRFFGPVARLDGWDEEGVIVRVYVQRLKWNAEWKKEKVD